MEHPSPHAVAGSESCLRPQVEPTLYWGMEYLTPGRLASYGHQLKAVTSVRPDSVLEIGIGGGLLTQVLRAQGVRVTSLDFDPRLKPDAVACVTRLPVRNRAVDVVACFEVLEHLPFGLFVPALREIRRTCRRHAVVSLPDRGPFYYLAVLLPLVGRLRWTVGPPPLCPPVLPAGGEHYWEINTKGCRLGRVRQCMRDAGFRVESSYRAWESCYHRFFLLSPC